MKGSKSQLPDFLSRFIETNHHLSREEEQVLARIIQDPFTSSDEKIRSRNSLVSANYKFALSVIRRYDVSSTNIDYNDLFQRAVEGLIEAAGKFKPDRGKFCTFAKFWIIAKVGGLIQKNIYCVKTTSTTKKKVEMVIDLANSMSHVAKEEITPQDVAALCGFNLDEIEVGLRGTSYIPADEASLSMTDATIAEIIFREHLLEVVRFLSSSDYDIIAMKYGLNGVRKRTSFEIGALYCVSGQRIRIVAKNILNRLNEEFKHERRGMLIWLE